MNSKPTLEELRRQIALAVQNNRRIMKQLSLQNQALVSMLPARRRPKKMMLFNPKTGRMEPVAERRRT